MKWKWTSVGFVSVVLAPILLFAYAHHYRTRVSGGTPIASVLVAKQRIPKGTPGSIVLSQSMYAATTLPPKEREDGAFADASYLNGHAAAVDILPGQQLTETNFRAGGDVAGG